MLAAALVLSGCTPLEDTPLARQGRASGDRIVLALSSYRGAHGFYPDALAQLVPTQLARVPPDWDAKEEPLRFGYLLDPGARVGPGQASSYRLLFFFDGNAICSHESTDPPKQWTCTSAM